MSIITGGEGGSLSSGNNNNIISSGKEERVVVVGAGKQEVVVENFHASNNSLSSTTTLSNGSSTQQFALDQSPPANKKKRNPPGNPDPSAEVIALSPNTLLARNRFVCEICNKGFQRDQNLQLHRRGHNLPWKLKQRNSNEIIRKRVYICPELSCVHHNPARALGDLTGIKKHFCRKHGEKKWKCEKCSKKYAVQSDYKAHSKTCGTREYKCECGTIFSRRDSFITHRAFCDAIAEENNKTTQLQQLGPASSNMGRHPNHLQTQQISSRELISSLINSIPPAPTATILNDSDNKYHHVAANPPATETPQVLIKQNNTNNNTIIPNHLIIKNPLDHHHHQQQVSLNNNNNMFSSSTTSLSLDHQHQEYQNGYMSATALLQKAAQMGSTVSTASSTMAPSSFGLDYNVNNGNGTGLGVFSGLIFDHGHNVHHGNNDITFMDSTIGSRNDVVLHGEKSCDNMGLASSTTGGDVMTVDFLGIGRSTRPAGNLNNNNFHEQKVQVLNLHHHQQQNNKQLFNGGSIEHQGLQGLSQFGMGKHVWEV